MKKTGRSWNNRLADTTSTGRTFFPLVTIQFEDKEFLCPRDCDTYLKAQYNNYMEIPKNIEHHIKEGQIEIW